MTNEMRDEATTEIGIRYYGTECSDHHTTTRNRRRKKKKSKPEVHNYKTTTNENDINAQGKVLNNLINQASGHTAKGRPG